ncbi:MAG: DUF6476 family protein [Rhodospirillales bacterium]
MLTLKTIVGVLTVLLVAGFGALVGGLLMQGKQRPESALAGAELTLPKDARIVETTQSGDRLVLRASTPDGQERLHVIDLNNGKLIGTIALKRAP